MNYKRRVFLATIAMGAVFASQTMAQQSDVWTINQVNDALSRGEIVLIDIRRPEEWAQTGVAKGAWPLDMTAGDFTQKLFQARELAEGRPVVLICRTANRSGFLMAQIRKAGLKGFVDTSGGMAGKGSNRGWIESDLPIVTDKEALESLPDALR